MLKTIAAGIVGIGLGVILAAWAETLDEDLKDDTIVTDEENDALYEKLEEMVEKYFDEALKDDTTVTEEEIDEALDDLATGNAS